MNLFREKKMLFSLFFDCLKKKKVSENNCYPCFLLPILTFPYQWFLLQNETLFLFLFLFLFLKSDFFFLNGIMGIISQFCYSNGIWVFFIYLFNQEFFVFSIWMLRKLRKEKEKNLIRVGFFLGCFVQGNEIEYSSLLSVYKFENFCFTDRTEWGCCWTFIFVKWKWRNFLIFVYFVVCLVILDWFYAFWNPMSTFLFIEYLLVFWIFIYF